jgi:precorrin-6A/cobalt-precorrin-6A reductase
LAAPRRILILGGTGEARSLAERLVSDGHAVITSIAGITTATAPPAGGLHRGGFGGAEGLAAFMERERIEIIVDATHPYAVQISRHGGEASCGLGLPLVRLERPPWTAEAGDCWVSVESYPQAAEALPSGAIALLTIGRRNLEPFFARMDVSGVARMIGVPDRALPANWLLLVARPPLRLEAEMALMRSHKITVAVSKNAGGEATAAKLTAARSLGLLVVMIERPAKPAATVVHTVEAAAKLLAVA